MKIDFVDETGSNYGLKITDLEFLANELSVKLSKTNGTVEVILVADKKIKQLNAKFRSKDSVTDVLSFPQKNFPSSKENVLGTIFIAPDYAERNNEDYETLFIHGLLHLFGFDHESDINQWREAEKKIKRKAL